MTRDLTLYFAIGFFITLVVNAIIFGPDLFYNMIPLCLVVIGIAVIGNWPTRQHDDDHAKGE